MNQTGINWCDRTWNPMTGCLHGCAYCYARKVAELRTKAFPHGFAPMFHPDRLGLPGKVKKPQSVFVGSMADMMGEWWKDSDIKKVIDVCEENDQHTFLWLTKNPSRYASFIWPDNCWLGATVTNQGAANKCAISLIQTRGAKTFLSIEPMHSGMILQGDGEYDEPEALRARMYLHGKPGDSPEHRGKRIHQVILGGETGPGAQPMNPDWVRSVRDQCAAAGVPFFFKSWGEWKYVINQTGASYVVEADEVEKFLHVPMREIDRGKYKRFEYIGNDIFIRVGKKAAGRLLDGREHNDLAWRISA